MANCTRFIERAARKQGCLYLDMQLTGENAIVYIEGDLTNPESLQAISNFVTNLNDNPYVAKRNGKVNIQSPRTIFHIVDQVMRSEYTISSIEESSGIPINDDGQLNEFHYHNKMFLISVQNPSLQPS